MNVVAFERKQDNGEWSEKELNTLVAALGTMAPRTARKTGRKTGRTWETGTTEQGDAQFYLLGPLPEQSCEICISRIGKRYILEDGSGRLLFEHRNLELVTLHAKAAVPSRSWLMVRVITLWCAVRNTIQEKVEPLLVEGEELFVQFVPQLAALA